VNGKARVEKIEDSYQARKKINVINIMNVILQEVVSRKTEKVHVLEDDCQIKKSMD